MKKMIWIALCICATACGGGNNESGLIEESKLVPLLLDVHLAEVAIQDAPSSAKDSVANLWYGYVFKQHNIKQEAFEKTMQVIRKDPKRIGKLYEKVQKELEKRK